MIARYWVDFVVFIKLTCLRPLADYFNFVKFYLVFLKDSFFYLKSVFYKNVLAKTVHTEIRIFGPIEIGRDLGSFLISQKIY